MIALRILVWASVAVAGCARGGSGASGDDEPKQDGGEATPVDARPPIDAPPPIDARPPIDAFVPPDAPPGSLFCTTNQECTTPGECCLTLGGPMGFCAPGTIILNQCVPF